MNLEYQVYFIKKTKRKYRRICEPNSQLKKFQKEILKELYQVIPHDCNHGFYPKRSIVTNALIHERKDYVLSLDINSYFDNTTKKKVRKILKTFFPEKLEFISYFLYKNSLPQGAPTSPYLANFALWDFDTLVTEYCTHKNISYTRYADDLTFSWNNKIDLNIFLSFLNKELRNNKYKFVKSKTKLMPKHKQQKVTGLVVNHKVNVPKKRRNLIRAYNHLYQTNNWNIEDIQYLAGNNGFLKMITA